MDILLSILGLLVLPAFVAAVYFGLSAWQRHDLKKVERVFHGVADRLGGRVTPGKANMFRWVPPVLEVEQNGIRVRVRTFSLPRRGQSSSIVTEARVPELRIRPKSRLDGLLLPTAHPERTLGGHPAFDERFVVAAPDHGAVERVVSTAVRDLLVTVPHAWVQSDGRTLAAHDLGSPKANVLETLVAVVGTIAAAARG